MPGEVGLGVPEHSRLAAGRALQRERHVALAIDAGEQDDGGVHARALTPALSRKAGEGAEKPSPLERVG